MTFYQFALKNLLRNKSRTWLTILSVTVATMTLFVVISLDRGYQAAVNEELVEDTGIHLFITREGCPIEAASVIAQGGISPLFVPETIAESVTGLDGVKDVLPFTIFAITTADGSRTDLFFGTTDSIQRIRPDWQIEDGSWFRNDRSVILGAKLAHAGKWKVGDIMVFEHFENEEFEVTGILQQNNTQDDGFIFLPLATAQRLINREAKLSGIGLQLANLEDLRDVETSIEGMLPEEYFVTAAKALSAGVFNFFASTRAMMLLMVIVALVVCTLGIANTLLMAAVERRKEFAYLKCVGAGFWDVTRLIISETLIISLVGIALGLGGSLLLLPSFENFVRSFLVVYIPAAGIVRPDIELAILTMAIVLTVSISAALYPAVKTARISPMEALRNE